MSNIEIKNIYDIEENIVYPQTSTMAVIDDINGEKLSDKLLTIDEKIMDVKKEINNINESITNLNIDEKINQLEIDIEDFKKDFNNTTNEYYNVHIKKENISEKYTDENGKEQIKFKKSKLYFVIENYNTSLNDDIYTIAFMKKSKKNGKGNCWRVPLFSRTSNLNKYYFISNEDGSYSPIANIGNKGITSVITELPSVYDLPCVDIKMRKNDKRVKKMYPYYKSGEINYREDTTYVFKNNNSKLLHIGYAIFKKVKNENNIEKWIRVSNIAQIDLYAYQLSNENTKGKFLINII